MNARTSAGARPYFEINREERFFCSSLYALLVQKNDNLKNFISYLNHFLPDQDKVNADQADHFEIYVEYSYLRDIWNSIGHDNDQKLRLIRENLRLSKPNKLFNGHINESFVGRGKPSEDYIQNPGTWSISKYSRLFPNDQGNEDFLKVCKFKWSFNIKPDLVIQIDSNRVLSIEAKLESPEGSYPSSEQDKKDFADRKLHPVRQTELQKFMFKELLGMTPSLFFLVKDKSLTENIDVPQITWNDIFAHLDFDETHPFIKEALKARGLVKDKE